MKALYLTIIAAIGTVFTATGQQRNFTQFYSNMPAYNAGFTGIEKYTEVKAAYKQNWSNFSDTDGHYYVSIFGNIGGASTETVKNNSLRISNPNAYKNVAVNTKLRRKHGIGGIVEAQNLGPYKDLKVNVNYAYHLPVSKKLMWALGSSIGIDMQRIDYSNLTVRNEAEDLFYQNLLNSSEGKQQVLNVSFGSVIYSSTFYFGLSANSAVQNVVNKDNNLSEIVPEKQYEAVISNNFQVGPKFELQPIARVYYSDLYDFVAEANVRARYNQLIYVGAGYKQDISASLLFGITMESKLNINYSYDYFLNKVNNYNNGVHELSVGLIIFNKYSSAARLW